MAKPARPTARKAPSERKGRVKRPKAPESQTVGVVLPTALLERLAAIEASRGYRLSLSALLREALEQRLKLHEPTVTPVTQQGGEIEPLPYLD